MNREIRSEQDAAFHASLEKDKQKRIENEKKQEAEKEAERLRKEKEDEKQRKIEVCFWGDIYNLKYVFN